MICRKCRYGVWPSQIEGHLKRAHCYILPVVHVQLADELDIPPVRTQAIPQLVGPLGGWQCQLSPRSYLYGHMDEANPWLRQTGWVLYLASFSSEQLLTYIDMPAPPMDDAIKDPNERAIYAIWTAMGELGQVSQQSVIHTGVFVRMEAIQTEQHQTWYQLLEAYQDPETIVEQESRTVNYIITRTALSVGIQLITYVYSPEDDINSDLELDPNLDPLIDKAKEISIPLLTSI
ncbi:conserved hypothetical protein [Talaromyces stipitatus ATCC 10500]|uniref:Uncharacterized protein n=1 Tax=Talaromyces stipitatus (strain ATCC 10500 / CBS 375.48 / QM 6759 / NRRL 1006) TaxID=441959 RepID=B8MVL7_TALSN|nr:uncharacterized protein TSTA_080550 [Talaromyces stipitatus ATCC 10500]EED11444.1 conserved hypothetical protein [Talaromyces stipitatus ATCC 10500]